MRHARSEAGAGQRGAVAGEPLLAGGALPQAIAVRLGEEKRLEIGDASMAQGEQLTRQREHPPKPSRGHHRHCGRDAVAVFQAHPHLVRPALSRNASTRNRSPNMIRPPPQMARSASSSKSARSGSDAKSVPIESGFIMDIVATIMQLIEECRVKGGPAADVWEQNSHPALDSVSLPARLRGRKCPFPRHGPEQPLIHEQPHRVPHRDLADGILFSELRQGGQELPGGYSPLRMRSVRSEATCSYLGLSVPGVAAEGMMVFHRVEQFVAYKATPKYTQSSHYPSLSSLFGRQSRQLQRKCILLRS